MWLVKAKVGEVWRLEIYIYICLSSKEQVRLHLYNGCIYTSITQGIIHVQS